MPNHVYNKDDVIQRLDNCLGKTLGEIDNIGMFENVQKYNLQKGIAGAVVEQCIFQYPPDTKQEADLIIYEDGEPVNRELKTTGVIIKNEQFAAKEPMSITAVSVFTIQEQEFWTSHFWNKLEHLLLVYYHYSAHDAVVALAYKDFEIVGYEFHEFDEDEIVTLKTDWENVRLLCAEVMARHPGTHDNQWKTAVKNDYIAVHSRLRPILSFIDLAPKFPPRFRLKQPTVNTIIKKHFNGELMQLPGRYQTISDIDKKCRELTNEYSGKTIKELTDILHMKLNSFINKAINESIIIAMFGGNPNAHISNIELFQKYGIIPKSIVVTKKGQRTEDMKLYHVDFKEMEKDTVIDESNGKLRKIEFEDSELYSYFIDNEFLFIIFEEAENHTEINENGEVIEYSHQLSENKFVGFKRLVFTDEFIYQYVKPLWEDTRNKITKRLLRDVVAKDNHGNPIRNKNGAIRSAPNFMKSSENPVFFRGSGVDSSPRYKTESVNGIRMLPQYVWIKGSTIVSELQQIENL